MPKTYTFTVDNVGSPEPIIPQSNCKTIKLCENGRAATSAFNVYLPSAADPAVQYAAGEVCELTVPFSVWTKGATIGYIETASGSWTCRQVET